MMKEKKFDLQDRLIDYAVRIMKTSEKLLRLDIPCSSVGYSEYRKDNQLPESGTL